jgi:signal transduction histidine kinase
MLGPLTASARSRTTSGSYRAGGRTTDPSQVETSQQSLDRLRLEVAELRASRERLTVAGDAERRSLERELHDGLQQRLVSLAVNLQLARDLLDGDPRQAGVLLAEMADEMQRGLDDTAVLAQRIYPPLIEAGGLGAALRAATIAAGVRATIEVTLGAKVAPEIAGAVYFCCLEALESAGQDARAAVRVRVEDGDLVFEVAGDGVPALDNEGTLRVRDRVEALGGCLTIDSAHGEESRLCGRLPLAR